MNSTLVVEVPIKTYLKKYLYGLEKLPYDSPIDCTKGGHIPIVIQLLFTGKMDLPYETDLAKDINDTIPVVLSWRKVDRKQVIITAERVRFFNQFLYKSFMDHLLVKVLAYRNTGRKEAELIREEMLKLDIIDDANFDAIKKALYRLRKSRNMELFYDKSCPAA
ncbi:MAG: hypothetical protein AAFO02_00535 [Bacteroidota bacterium]